MEFKPQQRPNESNGIAKVVWFATLVTLPLFLLGVYWYDGDRPDPDRDDWVYLPAPTRGLATPVRVADLPQKWDLLKWQYQPVRRSKSWQSTILRDRSEIEDLLDQSPSLRSYIHDHLDSVYQQAVKLAVAYTGLESDVFPASCPYNFDRILDLTFFPD